MSEQFWSRIQKEASSLLEAETNWIANLSNLSSLIYHELRNPTCGEFEPRHINWVGFYLVDSKNPLELVLGPFQGRVACVRIGFGRGVCGTAAQTRKTQLEHDVHQIPNHISCDPDSKSEIVIPIINDRKELLGVFDLDSSVVNGFNDEDRFGLEKIVEILVNSKTDFSLKDTIIV